MEGKGGGAGRGGGGEGEGGREEDKIFSGREKQREEEGGGGGVLTSRTMPFLSLDHTQRQDTSQDSSSSHCSPASA